MNECTFRPRLSNGTHLIADRPQSLTRSAGGSLTQRVPSLTKPLKETDSIVEGQEVQTLRENQDIESVVTTESEKNRRRNTKQRKEEEWLERQK